MIFYQHNITDYAEATSHLTFVEDAAYRRLICKYYSQECGFPNDIKAIQRLIGARTKEEKKAVEIILSEFFFLDGEIFKNSRCEEEIEKMKDKQNKMKANADKRWKKEKPKEESMQLHKNENAIALQKECKEDAIGMLTNNYKLITNKEEINKEEKISSLSGKPDAIPPEISNLADNLIEAMKEDSLLLDEPEEPKKDFTKDCKKVIDYLNKKTGSNFQMVDANIKLIRGRLKEGFEVSDLIRVIDERFTAWNNDDVMSEYLRPSTLFNKTKFAQYVAIAPKRELQSWEQ